MPPAMGQPINVVEKPSSTPGVAPSRSTARSPAWATSTTRGSRTCRRRPVDELARRLFDTGVTEVHANGSMVTVHLVDGWTGEKLLDVITRPLHLLPARGHAARRRPAQRGSAPADGSEPQE